MIEYHLVRSGRSTLSVEISREGQIIVRAPRFLSVSVIENFLREKQGWILEKQKQASERGKLQEEGLKEGAILPYLGGFLTISLFSGRVALQENNLLKLPSRYPRTAFFRWRMQQAEAILRPRAEFWSDQTGLKYTSLEFGNARSRWGSMASNGSMRLNTALLHCPMTQIDYVIVHELCHLLHPDHSPAFHAEVRRFLPDADKYRNELKKGPLPFQPTA